MAQCDFPASHVGTVCCARPRQLQRNRRFLIDLAEGLDKAPVPSIILNNSASDTLIALSPNTETGGKPGSGSVKGEYGQRIACF
jgi:hypothetical protein